MNIREFARKCSISPSTASRILNKSLEDSQSTKETYERVRKMAIKLGYKPNYAAKTLHTHRSNCLGVIIGFPHHINTMAIIRGVSQCTYEHGVSIAVASCNNDLKKEAKAFENMIYRGVDAIIWHPTFQRGEYSTTHIEKVLKKFSERPPVVCLSYNNMPGVFKFRCNSEEDAEFAAMRQLSLGCKKFGVICGYFCFPMHIAAKNAYIDTLRKNGVSEENIVEIAWGGDINWETLRGIDGLWTYFSFILHSVMPQLSQVCDLKKLHVDGQGFIEDYAVTQWTYSHTGERFEDLFCSMKYHLLDAMEFATKGTEIAIQAMKDPTLKPFNQPFPWCTELPEMSPEEILFRAY